MAGPPRYDVVDCVVTGHHTDGLLVTLDSGERGVVERVTVEDAPLPSDWPAVGTRLPAVVLGRTRDGRLRLAGRPSYVALVRSAADPEAALGAWNRIRAADEAYAEASSDLFDGPDAAAVLQWALSQPADSPQVGCALRALRGAPALMKLRLVEELLRLSDDDRHAGEVRQVLASIDLPLPAVPRAVPPPRARAGHAEPDELG
jgi:hypothetical protein